MIASAMPARRGAMYLILKRPVHVLSVVLFLGDIITGLFWKAHADGSGDPKVQAMQWPE